MSYPCTILFSQNSLNPQSPTFSAYIFLFPLDTCSSPTNLFSTSTKKHTTNNNKSTPQACLLFDRHRRHTVSTHHSTNPHRSDIHRTTFLCPQKSTRDIAEHPLSPSTPLHPHTSHCASTQAQRGRTRNLFTNKMTSAIVLDPSPEHVAYALLGCFIIFFGLVSLFVKEKLFISEACKFFFSVKDASFFALKDSRRDSLLDRQGRHPSTHV